MRGECGDGECGDGECGGMRGQTGRSPVFSIFKRLLGILSQCCLRGAAHKRYGCNHREWRNYQRCYRHPLEPLAAHDHCGRCHGYEPVADKQRPPEAVERLRIPAQFAHYPLIELRRQAWDRRGQRTPQQIVDPIIARFHLSHKNILSVSACHREADALDADTI
jgi:hypothetical protein